MPFSLKGKPLRIILAVGFLLVSIAVSFAAIHHSHLNNSDPVSDKILITPGDTSVAESLDTPTPVATAEAVSLQSSDVEAAPETIQLDHLIGRGVTVTPYKLDASDNYWTVADDNGINLQTLLGANPTMPFKAHLGLTVNLLSQKGVLHEVYPGETVKSIAELYHVDPAVIKNANNIHWWRGIRAGDVLFIPDVKPVRMLKEWKDYFSQRGFFGVPFAHWGEAITSGFGWRHDPITGVRQIHPGMDFRAKVGDAVFASAAGKVIFAGVAGGYGNLIKIHHNSTYTTYYGHLSQILVKTGQKVKRGQLIGRVGATGHVTGPHLHFEIRKNGRPINPLPLI